MVPRDTAIYICIGKKLSVTAEGYGVCDCWDAWAARTCTDVVIAAARV